MKWASQVHVGTYIVDIYKRSIFFYSDSIKILNLIRMFYAYYWAIHCIFPFTSLTSSEIISKQLEIRVQTFENSQLKLI